MILLAGQQVPARRSLSTVLPGIDFETYSEAGYVWSNEGFKWVSAGPAKSVNGLKLVGLGVYASHPSTEILCLSYDLKDGRGVRRWNPTTDQPHDLLDHVSRGYPIQAWNSLFEYLIWNQVAVTKLGWPPMKLAQMYDAMAKSRASSMPGKLAKASEIVGIAVKDTTKGTRVINRFSRPRNPTKNDSHVRVLPELDAQGPDLYDYCDQDVEAEGGTALALPDLNPFERAVWLFDQRVNIRGCHVDMPVVRACRAILAESAKRHDRELQELTEGEVARSSEVAATIRWLATKSVYMDALDEEAVTAALKIDMHPDARRVLEIRLATASAGAKKVESLFQQTAPDGQLRGLFMYHAAHTGRWASGGVQLHNMVSSGPSLLKCEQCASFYLDPHGLDYCPACKSASMWNSHVEWGYEPMVFALKVLGSGDYDHACLYFRDRVVHVIASCVRGMLIARPGFDLLGSDYSAIEAVVLAMLAGEEWRIEVFRTHGKIYEMCVSKITGVPFREILDYKKANGSHHPHRKPFGKVPELACFGPDTQVLTSRGYVSITGVLTSDKLWDGIEWVSHDGIVRKGQRKVIRLDGVRLTPDHPVSIGALWAQAWRLASNPSTLARALAIGSENLPCLASSGTVLVSNAHAGGARTWLRSVTYALGSLLSASYASVYDIVNAGPRHRFTIRTNSGHLLVHNSGYQGWIGAWMAFGADEFMTEDEIKKNILKWREESPMIVELWGGQYRKDPDKWKFKPELHGLEGAFVAAVLNPGRVMRYRYITYLFEGGNVYCTLPSGRDITYNNVRLGETINKFHGGTEYKICYWCWNTNVKKGPMGWTEVSTYGGSLTENVTQAVARDIFAHGGLVAESKGYEVVLHTHDELTAEVPVGFGGIEEFEACMMTLPDWCKDWPIRAAGGWRGREYRKD